MDPRKKPQWKLENILNGMIMKTHYITICEMHLKYFYRKFIQLSVYFRTEEKSTLSFSSLLKLRGGKFCVCVQVNMFYWTWLAEKLSWKKELDLTLHSNCFLFYNSNSINISMSLLGSALFSIYSKYPSIISTLRGFNLPYALEPVTIEPECFVVDLLY